MVSIVKSIESIDKGRVVAKPDLELDILEDQGSKLSSELLAAIRKTDETPSAIVRQVPFEPYGLFRRLNQVVVHVVMNLWWEEENW